MATGTDSAGPSVYGTNNTTIGPGTSSGTSTSSSPTGSSSSYSGSTYDGYGNLIPGLVSGPGM